MSALADWIVVLSPGILWLCWVVSQWVEQGRWLDAAQRRGGREIDGEWYYCWPKGEEALKGWCPLCRRE